MNGKTNNKSHATGRFVDIVVIGFVLSCLLFGGHLISGAIHAPSRDGSESSVASARTSGFGEDQSSVASTPANLAHKPIEQVQVGDRVLTDNPTGEEDPSLGESVDPATWRRIELRAPKVDGSAADVILIRPESWLQEQAVMNDKAAVQVGGFVEISVPECGIDGDAEVLAIEPCPLIQPGNGRVVTGTYKHSSAHIVDLYIQGLSEPIETTTNHPFWSDDRQMFVRADRLQRGERLRTLQGNRVVDRAEPRNQNEPVFNLEVQLDHTYFVSEAGILVHNAIGVHCNALDRMVRRLKGIRAGDTRAIESVEGFGSRFGSKFRGRGPRPDSDLDIFVRGRPELQGSRHQGHVEARMRQILRDFELETGIKVDLNADWLFPIFDPFRHGPTPPGVIL